MASLRAGDQACGDWIAFDVGADFLPLRGIAHPMIEGFILPKWLARAAENQICLARRRPLICCVIIGAIASADVA